MRPRRGWSEGGSIANHLGTPKTWGKTEVLPSCTFAESAPKEVTQMVTNRKKHSEKTPVKQGPEEIASEPNKINSSTPYDFNGKNLTPYGGLLPVITMLEKLGFQSLVEQTLTSKRILRAMNLYRFVLSIVLGLYIGFPRLNQLRFIARDPILTGILKAIELPVQSTFWRFVNALHRNVARAARRRRASWSVPGSFWLAWRAKRFSKWLGN